MKPGLEEVREEWRRLMATDKPPDIGPRARPGRLDQKTLLVELDALFGRAGLSAVTEAALRSAACLWHDHLEESHAISQTLHDATGSFLHGIMHRREPDFGNAKYWFYRVGQHPVFPQIGRKVAELCAEANNQRLREQLLPAGLWDPFAFVDACQAVVDDSPDAGVRPLLCEVQAIEMGALIEHLWNTAK